MQIVSGNTQMCVTCDHYVGEREPYCSYSVKYESTTVRGKCYESFPSGVPRYPSNGCPYWKKWGAVK